MHLFFYCFVPAHDLGGGVGGGSHFRPLFRPVGPRVPGAMGLAGPWGSGSLGPWAPQARGAPGPWGHGPPGPVGPTGRSKHVKEQGGGGVGGEQPVHAAE